MCGKKREPPPHNLESAERGREGALLETRPRASQGIRDPAAPPLRFRDDLPLVSLTASPASRATLKYLRLSPEPPERWVST